MKVYLLSRRIEHSLLVVCSLVFYFKYLDSVTWASVCPSATNNEPVLPGWKAGVSTGPEKNVLLGLTSTRPHSQEGAGGVGWD